MKEDESFFLSWRIPLLITAAIIVAIIAALLLAQIDSLQRRSALPARQLPVVDQDATVAAEEPNTIYLPGEPESTAAVSTEQPTTSPTLEPTPEATPLPIKTSELLPPCSTVRKNWSPYIVQPGDSLSSIANRFGVTPKSIAHANCLVNHQIVEGQVIYLPNKP